MQLRVTAQRPTYLSQQEGEIGVPCVAASCACLGAGKGQAERQSEKMLSFVRFFRLPPLPDTAAALRCPATLDPLHSAGAAPASVCGSKASRFRGSLLARGFLVAPPEPPSGSRTSQLISGGRRAPLVLRPCLRVRPAVPFVVR